MKRYIPYIFYFILAIFIMLPLLKSGYYLTLDMQFGPASFLDFQFEDFYGFEPSSYGAYFPLEMMLASISEISSVEIAEKLLLLLILFLSGAGMHQLVPEKEGNARYFAGLLYMLNPFVFARFLAGHWSLLLSYSLWPFCLKSYLEFLENPHSRQALAKTALLTTAASVSSHGILILMVIYAFATIGHFLKRGVERNTAIGLAKVSFLVLVMNLFWIVPTVLLYGETYNPAPAEAYLEDFAPQHIDMSLGASVATMHGFWRGGFVLTKDVFGLWPVFFYPLIAIVLLGAVRLMREKAISALFFIALFLAGFFLAFGEASPLSFLFTALGEAFPVYFIFRDSQKFVGLICLSYSYLGALGAGSIAARFPDKKNLVLVLLCLIPVAYNFGFFGFLGQIRPTVFPDDWSAAEAAMSADPSDGGVLMVPTYLYNWYPWANATQKTLGTPATQFFSRSVIHDQRVMTVNVYNDVNDPRARYLSFLYSKRENITQTAGLLMPLNARYVIVLKNYTQSTHSLFLFKRKAGVDDVTEIMNLPSLYLFRNERAGGAFMATNVSGNGTFGGLLRLSENQAVLVPVSYEKITPARYRIGEIPGRYLVFAQPQGAFFRYGGDEASPWFSIASSFDQAEGGGEFVNILFPIILFLFMLSWIVAFHLYSGLEYPAIAVLAVCGAAVYLLVYDGYLGPSELGSLILFSLVGPALYKTLEAGIIKAGPAS